MALPVVTIVGRPNVGKSSLLNLLARRQVSIVDPRAGITRDRVSVIIDHQGRYFELIDTGGIGIVDDDQLEAHVEGQIQLAMDRASLILFVVDAQQGLAPLDQSVAERLRRLDKPVLLVANKVDTDAQEPAAGDFNRLGFGDALRVSAAHHRGRDALLESVLDALGTAAEAAPGAPVMHLAIVGKRNAGKSTLVNALAGEERVIVSEVPGTTRDAVDVRFERDGQVFVAIDTAGVRKRSSMGDIDFYSYTRALRSIRRADVVMLLIDATVPVGEVDLKLARCVLDESKPALIALNKWDLVGDRATVEDFSGYLSRVMPALDFAPLVRLTASSGKNVQAAVDVAQSLFNQSRTRVSTAKLNEVVQEIVRRRSPAPARGTKAIRIYYATQVDTCPPTLVFFCNDPTRIREDYQRFLENQLRQALPFSEVPMRLLFRPRHPRALQSESSGARPETRRARTATSRPVRRRRKRL